MAGQLAPIDPALLALVRGSFGEQGLPMPFVREIFLLECPVAGTPYHAAVEAEPHLAAGDLLVFRREPANRFDDLAIAILDEASRQLGYVPRARNEVLARLMDAGKLVFGRLERKARRGHWIDLTVRVYMRDL